MLALKLRVWFDSDQCHHLWNDCRILGLLPQVNCFGGVIATIPQLLSSEIGVELHFLTLDIINLDGVIIIMYHNQSKVGIISRE